jgi:hypothetical protein
VLFFAISLSSLQVFRHVTGAGLGFGRTVGCGRPLCNTMIFKCQALISPLRSHLVVYFSLTHMERFSIFPPYKNKFLSAYFSRRDSKKLFKKDSAGAFLSGKNYQKEIVK